MSRLQHLRVSQLRVDSASTSGTPGTGVPVLVSGPVPVSTSGTPGTGVPVLASGPDIGHEVRVLSEPSPPSTPLPFKGPSIG